MSSELRTVGGFIPRNCNRLNNYRVCNVADNEYNKLSDIMTNKKCQNPECNKSFYDIPEEIRYCGYCGSYLV